MKTSIDPELTQDWFAKIKLTKKKWFEVFISDFPKVQIFAQRKGFYGLWLWCSGMSKIANPCYLIDTRGNMHSGLRSSFFFTFILTNNIPIEPVNVTLSRRSIMQKKCRWFRYQCPGAPKLFGLDYKLSASDWRMRRLFAIAYKRNQGGTTFLEMSNLATDIHLGSEKSMTLVPCYFPVDLNLLNVLIMLNGPERVKSSRQNGPEPDHSGYICPGNKHTKTSNLHLPIWKVIKFWL